MVKAWFVNYVLAMLKEHAIYTYLYLSGNVGMSIIRK